MTVAALRSWRAQDGRSGRRLYVWCPGCDDLHAVDVDDPATRWRWDGSLEAPTVEPSILVNGQGDQHPRCHSYLRGGRWEFLADSEHDLAGREAAMVPLPDWLLAS